MNRLGLNDSHQSEFHQVFSAKLAIFQEEFKGVCVCMYMCVYIYIPSYLMNKNWKMSMATSWWDLELVGILNTYYAQNFHRTPVERWYWNTYLVPTWLGVVYTMDRKVVPRSCKICDWLLNSSRDHFSLYQGEKCWSNHGVWSSQKTQFKAYNIHWHGPTCFAGGEAKDVLW